MMQVVCCSVLLATVAWCLCRSSVPSFLLRVAGSAIQASDFLQRCWEWAGPGHEELSHLRSEWTCSPSPRPDDAALESRPEGLADVELFLLGVANIAVVVSTLQYREQHQQASRCLPGLQLGEQTSAVRVLEVNCRDCF